VGKAGILSGSGLAGRSAGIWSGGALQALALVRPQTTDEVSRVMQVCHAAEQVVVPAGGMTGLAGGHKSTADDIVLSTERMNRIEAMDARTRTMVVEAGAILQTVQERAQQDGLMFALDLGARASCTIGGNIATNAGGVRVLRYGMMREQVLGLEAVLADGSLVSSMFDVLKNNTGYDLRQMFLGSEGTLGIVTRAVLRLYEAPLAIETALLAVPTWDKVMELLRYFDAALPGALTAFEVLWRDFYELNTGACSALDPPLQAETPFYVLMDVFISDIDQGRAKLESLLTTCLEQGEIVDGVLAASETERSRFWQIRENFEPEQQKFDKIYGYDVSLPLEAMPAYVESVRQQLTRRFTDAELFSYGHIGDGNLHFSIYPGQARDRDAVDEIMYFPLQALHGSISAEHGIGLEKKVYLKYTRSETEIELMRKTKRMMDPANILNPGKLFDL
ncbi:MAG: FAD-binding oxidoreductase, partial [Gammaproteobacteria bacterium]|nr:FAD-binding oxidoreductase [Gammaproteobacteria bacterium]